jgi:hypothetical protein
MQENTARAGRPHYGQPRAWPAGQLLTVTRGPAGGNGENHNRAHPANDSHGILPRPRSSRRGG